MGYVPPPAMNLDRFGLPRDYATYIWLLYKRRVRDESPERRRFLGKLSDGDAITSFGQQVCWR
jgi:hypothetical protein